MKNQFALFILFLFFSQIVNAQIPDIDPRQFIQIYEKRHTESVDTLWLYKFDTTIEGLTTSKAYKKHKVIDKDTELEISFNYTQLLNNVNTVGNFSLTATLNKTPIELSPFSEIGEKYRKIGLNSKPPSEIAKNLTQFLVTSQDTQLKIENLLFDFYKFDSTYRSIDSLYISSDSVLNYEKSLLSKEFIQLKDNLTLIDSYLSYFSEGGIETIESFLKIIGSSITRFEVEKKNLLESIDFIKKLSTYSDLSNTGNYSQLMLLKSRLESISDTRGTTFDILLEGMGYGSVEFLQKEGQNYSNFIMQKPERLSYLSTMIAREANSSIYRKLIKGFINLADYNPSEGDILRINLYWSNVDSGKDSSAIGKPFLLPIANFEIRNIGWRVEIVDQTSMVNRLFEDNLRSSYPLSPSNFKPTGGISLLWSYRNDERFYKQDGTKIRDFGRIAKWLEPSLGLNVSYLDFDSEKTFEIGLGPVVGLFSNKLFFNCGYNLHANKESPFYFGVGISFANVISAASSK